MKNLKMRVTALLLLVSTLFTECSVFAAETLRYTHTTYQKVAYNRAWQYNTLFANTKLGDNTAYCVDYGRRNPSVGTNLPRGRKLSDKATNILLNGYPYKTASEIGVSNNDEAYYATQLAFWMVANQESKKNALNLKLSDLSPVSGKETFLNNAKAGAERIIAAANANQYKEARPSLEINGSNAKVIFQNGKLVAGPYVVNGKNLVEDITVTLENAPASAKLNKTSVKSGEEIYVEMAGTEVGSKATIKVASKGAKYEGVVFETSPRDMQDFGTIEKTDLYVENKIDFKWDTVKGNVNVIKVDQNNDRIKGVVFELQKLDGTKVAEGTTNDNGVVSFENVEPGQYKLVETKAPNGYIKGDKPLEFVVETGKTFDIKVENTKILGKLKIVKTDDLYRKPLAGVKFEILNSKKELVDTIVTDKNGIAVSKELAQGKYFYKEVEAPDYIVLDTKAYDFEIVEHNKEVVKEVVNTRIKGMLEIEKLDKDTKKPIEGVEFKVMDEKGEVIKTVVTNKDGIATVSNLEKGKYSYVETKAAKGYVLPNTKYVFEIVNNNDVAHQTVFNTKETIINKEEVKQETPKQEIIVTEVKETLPVTGGMGTNTVIFTVIATLTVAAYITMKKVL